MEAEQRSAAKEQMIALCWLLSTTAALRQQDELLAV
jgi:hypothetical protein